MLRLNRGTKVVLGAFTLIILGFMYIPLIVIVVNSFNSGRVSGWPRAAAKSFS